VRSCILLKYSAVELGSSLAEEMTLDVLIAEQSLWVHVLQDLDEIIESGIQLAKRLRAEVVSFCPVRSAAVLEQDVLKPLEQFAVRYLTPVRLELDNPNPACLLSNTGTQPDIIAGREAYFYREVGSKPRGVGEFALKPITEFAHACLSVLIRDGPLGGMLGIPALQIENSMTVIYGNRLLTDQPGSEPTDEYV